MRRGRAIAGRQPRAEHGGEATGDQVADCGRVSDRPPLNVLSSEAEVISSDLPVLVDFGAVRCGPCKALEPTVAEIAGLYSSRLKVVKVDIDDSPSVAARCGIRGVPTVVVIKGGREVKRQVGNMPKSKLVDLINDEV